MSRKAKKRPSDKEFLDDEYKTKKQQNTLSPKKIEPLTANQKATFDAYYNDSNLLLHGYPGTGKSFIASYLALKTVADQYSDYTKVIFVRSIVPSRDIGFLPGTSKQKAAEYETPYMKIVNDIYGRGDAYQILKQKGLIDFTTTSFNRGITLENCILIVDEIQNMNAQELHTIITRVGNCCKIIFSGDIRQTDLIGKYNVSGIADFMRIIKEMSLFECIEFGANDIVRSNLVKQYILTRMRLEETETIKSL